MPAMIADSAIYVEGVRVGGLGGGGSPEGLYAACRTRGGMAWVGLLDPTREELDGVAEELSGAPCEGFLWRGSGLGVSSLIAGLPSIWPSNW